MAFFASEEFDEKFRYDGRDLGAGCTEEGTVFKVRSEERRVGKECAA